MLGEARVMTLTSAGVGAGRGHAGESRKEFILSLSLPRPSRWWSVTLVFTLARCHPQLIPCHTQPEPQSGGTIGTLAHL